VYQGLGHSHSRVQPDGRLGRARATRRARRLTGLDWTYSALMILEGLKDIGGVRMTELPTWRAPPTHHHQI